MKILDNPYKVSTDQIEFYRSNRFIKLKQVLDQSSLDALSQIIGETVERLNEQSTPLAERDTYGKAFLQLFNLWKQDPVIKDLVLSARLGSIATQLMEVSGVRLYHDQALFKEAGGGMTPWHADQYYWPLATDKTITAWIPLQATPLEMGPLEFSAGSHQLTEGRDLQISDQSEEIIQKKLRISDFEHVIEPFDAGEISFHSGWVFHRAGANTTDQMRQVMTIIYMDKDMVLKQPQNKNQQLDWDTWCPGARVGEVIDTPLNPIIYARQ